MLPPGQTLVTAAGPLPAAVEPEHVLHMVDGELRGSS